MSVYFAKSSGSTLDYTFDWGFQFLEPDETILEDVGWAVVPDETGGLRIDQTALTATTTTAYLAGGVPGHAYLVSSQIRTSAGREIRRTLTLRIADS